MGISEINYDIQFEPLFSNFTFKGMEILSFKTTPSNKFVLNCAEIKIKKCYILSKNKTIDVNFKLDAKNESLSIVSKSKVSGKIKLCIEYAGILNDRLLGFYRSKYTDPSGKIKYTGECILTNYAMSSPVGDVVAYSADLQVSGAVTRGTH